MKKILIATDDGPNAEKVASAGMRLAQQLSAEVALVSVVDTQFLMTEGAVSPRELVDSMKEDFRKSQELMEEKIFRGISLLKFIEEGSPHEMIIKVAGEWNADLIVIGTHGRTGLSHLLMGSVAEKVIRHSSRPLYVIPTKEAEITTQQ